MTRGRARRIDDYPDAVPIYGFKHGQRDARKGFRPMPRRDGKYWEAYHRGYDSVTDECKTEADR